MNRPPAKSLEALLDAFEEAWRVAPPLPEIDDYLLAAPHLHRAALLWGLVRTDLERRIGGLGQPITVETAYLARYPEMLADRSAILSLILREFELRLRREPTLTQEEYLRRFPEYESDLAAHWANMTTRRTEAGSTPTDAAAPWPVVPGFELQAHLGQGGMGVVYQARQVALDRTVALKMVLAGTHASAEQRTRFLAEAQAVASLQHPHIIQIHEIGECDGLPYFVLEFADGGSLDRRLAGSPLPCLEAVRLTEILARAMAYAHEQGIVHRDLKPANVLLISPSPILDARKDDAAPASFSATASPGTVMPKITDFGLAKRLDREGPTRSQVIMGTPSYMAPELAEGRARDVGPAADVYALGAILYECLTGRPPFLGVTPMDTLQQVLAVDPIPPSHLQPKLPRDLDTICLKCLRKEPHRRYLQALDLAEDLQRFQAGRPILARPVGLTERGVKWVKRSPLVAGLSCLLVLVTLTGLAWVAREYNRAEWERTQAVALAGRESEARAEAQEAQATTAAALKDTQAARDDLARALVDVNDTLYVRNIALAETEHRDGKNDRADEILRQCLPRERRGWEWHVLTRLCHETDFKLRGHNGSISSVMFSPDSLLVATAGQEDGDLKIWRVGTGQLLKTLHRYRRGQVRAAVWSPDGRWLAVAGTDRLVELWNFATGQVERTLDTHQSAVTSVAFRSDSQCLVTGSYDNTIKIWNVEKGREIRTLAGHTQPVEVVAFSPDGKQVASASQDGSVRLWEAESGKELLRLTGRQGHHAQALAFSPDGLTLAFRGQSGEVILWDLLQSKERRRLPGKDSNHEVRFVFGPKGNRLAADTRLWDSTTGQLERQLPGGEYANLTAAAFSPDGQWLAMLYGYRAQVIHLNPTLHGWTVEPREGRGFRLSPDGELAATEYLYKPYRVDVRSVSSGKKLFALSGHEDSNLVLAFDPTRRWIATRDSRNTIRLWDTTGKEIRTIRSSRQIFDLTFTPDGNRLFVAADDHLFFWELPRGTPPVMLPFPKPSRLLTFSPDGRWLAAVRSRVLGMSPEMESGLLHVWDMGKLPPVKRFDRRMEGLQALASSPDGQWLAAAGDDRTVTILNAMTGNLVMAFPGHSDPIQCLAFHPDGTRLASAGVDQTVRIWDLKKPRELVALRGHTEMVRRLSFSPDGLRLVSLGLDGVRIWDGTPRPSGDPHADPE